MAYDRIDPNLDAAQLRIGIVQARFNAWAGEALLKACLGELASLGVDEDDITVLTVPGALEVPIALAALADRGEYDALIGLGCVIRGETYHFEIVADQSAAGLMRLSLDARVPVVNGILTTETDDQARARTDEKGRDAARVAVEMANLLWTLDDDGSETAE
jgi:6,7-dimethyl-8-ribityllumazine synthase